MSPGVHDVFPVVRRRRAIFLGLIRAEGAPFFWRAIILGVIRAERRAIVFGAYPRRRRAIFLGPGGPMADPENDPRVDRLYIAQFVAPSRAECSSLL